MQFVNFILKKFIHMTEFMKTWLHGVSTRPMLSVSLVSRL